MQSQLGAVGLGPAIGTPICLVEGVEVRATKLPTSAKEKIAERSSVFIGDLLKFLLFFLLFSGGA